VGAPPQHALALFSLRALPFLLHPIWGGVRLCSAQLFPPDSVRLRSSSGGSSGAFSSARLRPQTPPSWRASAPILRRFGLGARRLGFTSCALADVVARVTLSHPLSCLFASAPAPARVPAPVPVQHQPQSQPQLQLPL